jgi:hypothetical protein
LAHRISEEPWTASKPPDENNQHLEFYYTYNALPGAGSPGSLVCHEERKGTFSCQSEKESPNKELVRGKNTSLCKILLLFRLIS